MIIYIYDYIYMIILYIIYIYYMIIYALQHHQQFYSVDSTQTKINKNVFYVSLHLGHNYVCGKCRKMLVKVFSSSRSWSMGVTQKPLQSSPQASHTRHHPLQFPATQHSHNEVTWIRHSHELIVIQSTTHQQIPYLSLKWSRFMACKFWWKIEKNFSGSVHLVDRCMAKAVEAALVWSPEARASELQMHW